MIYGNPIIVNSGSSPTIQFWADVQAMVRAGKASQIDPALELPVNFDSSYADTTAIFVGYDNFTPTDTSLTSSATFQLKTVVSNSNQLGAEKVYDYKTPFCIVGSTALTKSMPVQFTVPSTIGGYAAGTYKVTLKSNIPAGAYLSPTGKTWTDAPIMYYDPATQTSGTAGTAVVGTSPIDLSNWGTVKFTSDVYYGSSNYSQSTINEWLNGNATYVPSLQKCYLTTDSYKGVYGNLSDDLKPYIASVQVPYISIFGGTVSTMDSKIFLPASAELGGGSAAGDGTVLKYYESASNTDRIRYDVYGTARQYWTRTPTPSNAYSVFGVGASGSLGLYNINTEGTPLTQYCSPLFVIA